MNAKKENKKMKFGLSEFEEKYLLFLSALYVNMQDEETGEVTTGWTTTYYNPQSSVQDGAQGAEVLKMWFKDAPVSMFVPDEELAKKFDSLSSDEKTNAIKLGIYKCRTTNVRKKIKNTYGQEAIISQFTIVSADELVQLCYPLQEAFEE